MTKEQIRKCLDKSAPDVISFQLTIKWFCQSENAPERSYEESYTELHLPDQLSCRYKSAKYNRDLLQQEKPISFVWDAYHLQNLCCEKFKPLNEDNQSPSDDKVFVKITCKVQLAKKK
jgi:hypothetical protein